MKKYLFLLLLLLPFNSVSAQEINLDYDKCEVTRMHDYMYIPFGITITHDPAVAQVIKDYHPDNPVAQLSKQVPENPSNDPSQATWITLSSNSTALWYIQVELAYAELKESEPRKITIEYKSNTVPIFIEELEHSGRNWCRIFEITSRIMPHQFTEEEILTIAGEIDKADRLETKQLILENSNAVKGSNQSMSFFALILVAVIVVMILMIRSSGAFSQETAKRANQLNIDQATFIQYENVTEMTRDMHFNDILNKYDKMLTRFVDTIGIALNLKEVINKYKQTDDKQKPEVQETEQEKLMTKALLKNEEPEQHEDKGKFGFMKKEKEPFDLEKEIEKFYNEYKNKAKYSEDKLIGIFNINYKTALKNTNSTERARVEAVSKVLKERREQK